MCIRICRNWQLWIKPFLILIYGLFVLILVPILIVKNVNEGGFNKKEQLIFVSFIFVLCALPVTLFHIVQHILNYNQPILQKHIIRILWMVPIYSLNGFLALMFPKYSLYMDSLREVYEAYVIYNFMKYLLNYLNIGMDLEVALEFKPQVHHFFPLCWVKPWKMGRELVHNCKHGVLIYTTIRPISTVIAMICEWFKVYDEGNFSYDKAFPYITFINNVTQFIAMYCLVLFYKANYLELKPMRPLPKFLCIKAVVFFSFFQSVIISLLVYFGVIKDVFNSDIPPNDYKLLSSRLQNFLICFEMFIAAVAHKYSFPVSPFQINVTRTETSWYQSLCAMLDVSDVSQDVAEHFGVVGGRLSRGFRGRPESAHFTSEQQYLLPGHSTDIQNHRKINSKQYGSTDSVSQRTSSPYKIKENQKDSIDNNVINSENNSECILETPSASSSQVEQRRDDGYLGINVQGPSVDSINYQNPNV